VGISSHQISKLSFENEANEIFKATRIILKAE